MVLIPTRSVQENLLYSSEAPVIHIKVEPSFTYVGSLSFILSNVAQVEQHHFVIADPNRHVVCLLWVQFEGYLDNNQYTYNYPNSTKLELEGYEFLHDSNVLNIDEDFQHRPDSDSAQVVTYLRKHGYDLSGDTIFKRLVWLDSLKRKELMIIYSEDLKALGLDMDEVVKIDKSSNQWVELAQDLHKRALKSFTIVSAQNVRPTSA